MVEFVPLEDSHIEYIIYCLNRYKDVSQIRITDSGFELYVTCNQEVE